MRVVKEIIDPKVIPDPQPSVLYRYAPRTVREGTLGESYGSTAQQVFALIFDGTQVSAFDVEMHS